MIQLLPTARRAIGALTLAVVATCSLQIVTAVPAGALTCGPARTSHAAVGVVVDFGDGSPQADCVSLPMSAQGSTTATGIDALKAAGHSLRIEGGFLCAIDGEPATGCATGSGFDGWYWRYYKAAPNSSWAYSSVGFGYRIALTKGCAAEGWVWSDAPGHGKVPGVAASLNCPSLPTTTTTRVPTTAPPTPNSQAPAGVVPGQGQSGGLSSGGGANQVPVTPSLSSGSDPGTGSSSAGPGGAATAPSAASPEPGHAQGSANPSSEASEPQDPSAVNEGNEQSTSQKDRESAESARNRHRGSTDGDGAGSPVGVIVTVAILGGVAAIAAFRIRSKRQIGSN